MVEGTIEKVTVVCTCGAKLSAPASAAGRQANCPRCQSMLTIPAPPLVAEPDTYEPPPLDGDSLDTLAKLAAHERAAATADPTIVNCCPDCRAMLPDGAVLCTSCGLNLQTGKRLKTAIADKKTATPKTPAQGGVLSRFLRRPGR